MMANAARENIIVNTRTNMTCRRDRIHGSRRLFSSSYANAACLYSYTEVEENRVRVRVSGTLAMVARY